MKANEKKCPKCAELIMKEALVCKHCGNEFSREEIAAQAAKDLKTRNQGCLVVIGVIVVLAIISSIAGSDKSASTDAPSTSTASSTNTASPPEQSTEEKIANYQVLAQEAMKSSLKDPSSAKYEDVEAHEVAETPGAYVFCGRVNAKNGFGGYIGFQHFVAGPGVAATEDTASDFAKVWNKYCVGPGTSVWF